MVIYFKHNIYKYINICFIKQKQNEDKPYAVKGIRITKHSLHVYMVLYTLMDFK